MKAPRSHPGPREFPWAEVLGLLAERYEGGQWKIPYLNARSRDPFRVLVSTILSQRTRDEVTYPVADALFEQLPTFEDMASVPLPRLEKLIHRVGFPHAKAQAIQSVARRVREEFGGNVPSDLETLLTFPMVGRKTANCVLVYGFNKPAIPVDTHVHRISHLLGVTNVRTPEETERVLMDAVPRPLWKSLNPLFVQHGQNICRPTGPRCGECPIQRFCATGRRWAAKNHPG